MTKVFWILLAVFGVIDVIGVSFVIRRRLKRTGLDFTRIGEFSKRMAECIDQYMRANYSGRPDQLPAIVRGLMPEIRRIAAEEGSAAVEESTLRMLVTTTIANRGYATRAQLATAFENLDQPGQPAAA